MTFSPVILLAEMLRKWLIEKCCKYLFINMSLEYWRIFIQYFLCAVLVVQIRSYCLARTVLFRFTHFTIISSLILATQMFLLEPISFAESLPGLLLLFVGFCFVFEAVTSPCQLMMLSFCPSSLKLHVMY